MSRTLRVSEGNRLVATGRILTITTTDWILACKRTDWILTITTNDRSLDYYCLSGFSTGGARAALGGVRFADLLYWSEFDGIRRSVYG